MSEYKPPRRVVPAPARKTVVNIKKQQRRSLGMQVNEVSKNLYAVVPIAPGKITKMCTVLVKGLRWERSGAGLIEIAYDPRGIRLHCNCRWAQFHGEGCVHSLAVVRHLAALQGRNASFWNDLQKARKQRQLVVRVGKELWAVLRRSH